jgi:hypothetical protein
MCQINFSDFYWPGAEVDIDSRGYINLIVRKGSFSRAIRSPTEPLWHIEYITNNPVSVQSWYSAHCVSELVDVMQAVDRYLEIQCFAK